MKPPTFPTNFVNVIMGFISLYTNATGSKMILKMNFRDFNGILKIARRTLTGNAITVRGNNIILPINKNTGTTKVSTASLSITDTALSRLVTLIYVSTTGTEIFLFIIIIFF